MTYTLKYAGVPYKTIQVVVQSTYVLIICGLGFDLGVTTHEVQVDICWFISYFHKFFWSAHWTETTWHLLVYWTSQQILDINFAHQDLGK